MLLIEPLLLTSQIKNIELHIVTDIKAKMTYALAAARKPPQEPPDPRKQTAQRLPITHNISSTPELDRKIYERERRTHILRKVPPATTTSQVLASVFITYQLALRDLRFTNFQLEDCVESIVRDTNDRRRFYITYKSYDLKKAFAAIGYTIGTTIIKPEYGDVSAYIPEPPFYLDSDDFASILAPYGTMVNPSFVRTNGIRTGGFHFSLTLKENVRLPEYLSFDGHMMEIVNKSSLKKCSNCDKFGHTRRQCHKLASRRMQELEKRAEEELAEQMAEDGHDQRDAQFEEFINPQPANLTHPSPTPSPESQPTQPMQTSPGT